MQPNITVKWRGREYKFIRFFGSEAVEVEPIDKDFWEEWGNVTYYIDIKELEGEEDDEYYSEIGNIFTTC